MEALDDVYVASVLARVKVLMRIDGSTLYDDELDILIKSAFAKLEGEGVPLVQRNSLYFDLYCIAVAGYVSQHLDLDIDLAKLNAMYTQVVLNLKHLKLKGVL